jgi:hypothetical protein
VDVTEIDSRPFEPPKIVKQCKNSKEIKIGESSQSLGKNAYPHLAYYTLNKKHKQI